MTWWPKSKVSVESAESAIESASLWRNIAFGQLWGSQILSQVAQNLLNFALIIRVFELTQHTRLANFSVALLILSFGVPSIFFAAAAGVYVDRWNRKYVLVVANALRAVLVLGYLFFETNLVAVLLLSFIISTATQFFAPAEAAAIPALVKSKGRQLLRANSLFIFTMYASFVVGYSASAPVIALMGNSGPYIVTALMFAFATVLVIPLPSIKATARRVAFSEVVRNTGREVLQNWRLIRSNRYLSGPIYILAITQTTVGVLIALAPALSEALLGIPMKDSSHYLILPAGFGMVVGVVSLGWLVKAYGKRRVVRVGLLVGSVALLLVGIAGLVYSATAASHRSAVDSSGFSWLAAALVFIMGVATSAVSAAAQTMLQEHTTDESRGKVFGALNMMINIAATAPIFFAGILADLFGVLTVIVAIALAVTAYAAWHTLPRRIKSASIT